MKIDYTYLLIELIIISIISSCCLENKVEQPLVCTKPYISKDGACCLDSDDDGFCDTEEITPSETTNTETMTTITTTTIRVTTKIRKTTTTTTIMLTCNSCEKCTKLVNESSQGVITLDTDLYSLYQTCITITRDNVELDCKGHAIDGHYAKGYRTHHGIYIENSSNVTIRNCNVAYFSTGIFLYFSSNNALYNNKVDSNEQDGICMYYSSYNLILGNTINSNLLGIESTYSYGNVIVKNTVVSNSEFGIWIIDDNYDVITDNKISSNARDGISVDDSNFSLIANNTVNLNENGFYIASSSWNVIQGNSASSNKEHGLYLTVAKNNTIIKNNFCKNKKYDILMQSSGPREDFVRLLYSTYNHCGNSLYTATNEVLRCPYSC